MGTLAYNLSQDRPLWSVVSHYVSVWLRTFTQCYILETTDPSGLLLSKISRRCGEQQVDLSYFTWGDLMTEIQKTGCARQYRQGGAVELDWVSTRTRQKR
jgi:hypothetical protein